MKFLKYLTISGLAVTGLAITSIGNPATVQAKTSKSAYKIANKASIKETYFHIPTSKKNIYMWNSNHTKKLLNVKDYPNANWYSYRKYTLSKNNKKSVYYQVTGHNPNRHTTETGLIWHGYLKTGYNKNWKVWNDLQPGQFANDQDYYDYIQQSPSQKFTKAVLKLFPNTQLSKELSSDLIYEYYEKDWTDVIKLPGASKYFDKMLFKDKVTETQRLELVKQALDKAGYDQTKRDSLSDYKIGVFYSKYPDWLAIDQYPGIVLAKPKN
ncbi:hypothetical protein [Lentilactobacillus sp. Marseille-Q4993]|uniref:hypothetical protein n=1 Tax=Lentilactobacillus sp. Marseille-Q4993 TaxID=3039492 RepID=UPI0024BC7500|nr:hypothetical protein [Lentilactobacillus sp. Marseille-Q4993]